LHKCTLLENLFFKMPLHVGKMKGVGWCYHLRIHFHSMFVSLDLNLNIYVSMIMTSYMVTRKMVFILLTFGCGEWDYELYWKKSNMKLEFDSPSKCLCLVCKFELLNWNASMSFFVCVFYFFFSNGTTFSTGFLGGC
jgi:hypothetical protein